MNLTTDNASPSTLTGPTVGLVSLGCPKNLVDSEVILGRLAASGFTPTADPADAEVLIVNTCGFIGPAKEESIDTLLELAQHKVDGRCRYLISTGCLTQRYAEELKKELPEVDAWIGFSEYARIDKLLWSLYHGKIAGVPVRVSDPGASFGLEEARLRLTPAHYAYLRISEGCDKTCTFCSIPSIRGRFRSKPIEDIVTEAQQLIAGGARELNLISQDTPHYGVDLYRQRRFGEVLARLDALEGLDWIRQWYIYPGTFPPGMLDVMARPGSKVIPYLDMPIQHGDVEMLRAMRRPGDVDGIRAQVATLRERVPGIVLRTSVIVGFPGETDRHFENLLELLEELAFERVGVFLYSREEGTPAATLPDQVPEPTKRQRHDRVVALSCELLEASHERRVGRVELALVDGPCDDDPYSVTARTTGEGPEVDPILRLPRDPGRVAGQLLPVEITGTDGVDLIGRPVGPPRQ